MAFLFCHSELLPDILNNDFILLLIVFIFIEYLTCIFMSQTAKQNTIHFHCKIHLELCWTLHRV